MAAIITVTSGGNIKVANTNATVSEHKYFTPLELEAKVETFGVHKIIRFYTKEPFAKKTLIAEVTNVSSLPGFENLAFGLSDPDQIKAQFDSIANSFTEAGSGGGGGGLTQSETTAAIEDALTANADIETIKNQLAALVVTSYSQGETQTAATGTNWTALASGATKNVTVRNRTGTNIDIRTIGGAVFFTLANGEDITLPVFANSNEWQIKRSDNSNTPVTVKFLRFA